MNVYLSDLHLTDADVTNGVRDADLAAFVDRFVGKVRQSGSRGCLVFAGDILELLRSRRWSALWASHASAPWSGAVARFTNFPGGHADNCAVSIAQDIETRYAMFSERLHTAVAEGVIQTIYLPGNHDYMVQLSPRLREIVVRFLALNHDPARPFPLCHTDRPTSVYATHGHAFDPLNWHREVEGHWAMGDAVVLRVVNRFAEDACARLGLAPGVHLGRLVEDVENVEPVTDVPLYIRWIADSGLSGKAARLVLLDTWKTVVDEFLALPEFTDRAAYGTSPYKTLRRVLKLSTNQTLSQLANALPASLKGGGPDYRGEARKLARQQGFRFVLFGHTHEPGLLPTGVTGGDPTFYANAGCWRRVVARATPSARGPFVARRIETSFAVDTEAGPDTETHRIHTSWGAR